MVKSVARQTRLKLDERIGEVVADQLGQVPQQIEAEGQLLQLKQRKATNVKDKLVMKPDGRTKDYANTSFVLSSFRGLRPLSRRSTNVQNDSSKPFFCKPQKALCKLRPLN